MNFNKFINTLFSYHKYEKICYLPINKPSEYKGVLLMIPSIAITAYILDIDYESIKNFYYTNIKYCEKYEVLFRKDYENYLNILSFLKNNDIISKLKNKFPNIDFVYNNIEPLEYDVFINNFVANILRYKDIIYNNKHANENLNYVIDFITCNNYTDDETTNKILNEIKNIIKPTKKQYKVIKDSSMFYTNEKTLYIRLHMSPSFDVASFIKLVDKLKKYYNEKK